MNIKIGDFVKGITNDYCITNTKMTRGLVVAATDTRIDVKVLEHDQGETGTYTVDPSKFQVIGHQKPFDRTAVIDLLKQGCKKAVLDYNLIGADLIGADLSGANLIDANLSGADLSGADLRRPMPSPGASWTTWPSPRTACAWSRRRAAMCFTDASPPSR